MPEGNPQFPGLASETRPLLRPVLIGIEPFSVELFEEILPLARKCWRESTLAKGETCAFYGEREFVIEPDVEQYLTLARIGALLLVTLRDGRMLQGYMVGILYSSLHHRGARVGGGDSIYIEPDYRAYTAVVAEKFEGEMLARGATVIGWPTHVDGPVYPFLKARGYVGDDLIMEKKLCASPALS